ncbi:Srfbp1 [Columba guinea]|nr:Srfbp1 [Columba guinea]
MAPVLNLNNEVVKMRKDVKKARVLTIRRLTRHIAKLKLKKGSEDLKLKNQKRVERLIEEIHAMKTLVFRKTGYWKGFIDPFRCALCEIHQVESGIFSTVLTKQGFSQISEVEKDMGSGVLNGLTDADILKAACTQAILAKYIQAVSSVGVMSAGLERMDRIEMVKKDIKPDEVTRLALRTEVNFESVCRKPNCTATERAIARLATHPILKPRFVELKAAVKAFKDARKNPATTIPAEEQPKSAHFNSSLGDQGLKQACRQQGYEHKPKMSVKIETDRVGKDPCESKSEQETVEMERASAPEESSFQAGEVQAVSQNKTGKKLGYQKRKENMSMNKLNAIKEIINDDSDQEQPNEEEYFDDSTEERFYNQSSDSDSDSNDDFFIGKVKRKNKIAAVDDLSSANEKGKLQKNVVKNEKNTSPGTAQNVTLEEGKSRAKTSRLESMFCSSLSTSNEKSQNRRRNTKDQPLKNGRTALLKKEPQLKKQPFAKAAGIKCDNKKASLEQPLHPSWEASRRRREQMSQITAFQGKKIKFDD